MTGVRVKHLPTGISVTATERRSQEQNRVAATERLKNKIKDLYKAPKVRIKTKSSRRSVEERLTEKHNVSRKKESRRVTRGDFEK
jgi:protein subunit release factor A